MTPNKKIKSCAATAMPTNTRIDELTHRMTTPNQTTATPVLGRCGGRLDPGERTRT